MAQARRTSVLDLPAFLQAVQRRLDNGAASFADATRRAVARHDLDPQLEAEALERGLVEIARDVLGTGERDRIVRTVAVTRTQQPGESRTISVSVTRSELRDWPVITVLGYKRLEDCTIEEAEAQLGHFDQTINGLKQRRTVVKNVIDAAKQAGVARIGELPDDTLNACLV